MPGLEDWLLPAIGATAAVVVIAAVAVLRSTGPSRGRRRPTGNRGLDLRAHAGRLAGPVAEAFASLTAMDALAEDPEQRAAVVALLAEHLRGYSDRGDDAVTQAVQQCLIRHLRAQTREPRAGAPLDLDLAGAHLRGLDLSRLSVRGLSLAHARLAGSTRLSGLRCEAAIEATGLLCDGDLAADELYAAGGLRLARSVLTNLDLTGAFVQGTTDLSGAQVTGSAWLTGAVLPAIRLHGSGPGNETANFTGPVDLQGVMCDHIQLHGTEFCGGLTITINQDAGIGREIAARAPETAALVREALFYDLK